MKNARAFVPHIVPPEPSIEDVLRSLLDERDNAAAMIVRVDALIAEHGRRYIAEKYPNAREYLKPSVDRVRRELGR